MRKEGRSLRIWDNGFYEAHKQDIEGVIGVVRDDPDLIFLPRGGYLSVYYIGTVILEYNGKEFKFNRDYLSEEDKKKVPAKLTFDEWKCNLDTLKESMICKNERDPKKGQQREKASQQEIMLKVNNNPDSEYSIIDMEYVRQNCPFGRFDLIAVSRKPGSGGKHKIAIIELKYGRSAFATAWKKENKAEGKNPFGSGIVGHAFNLNCFINEAKDERDPAVVKERLSDLAAELVSISHTCKGFCLRQSVNFPNLQSVSDLDFENIKTWLLCVGSENVTNDTHSIQRYLGYNDKKPYAKYTVKENVSKSFSLDYQITSEKFVSSLCDSDFKRLPG